MERKQFTFYRSYWQALSTLPKKDRLAAYEAIVNYALNGIEPQLTGSAATAFILIRPTLDTAKRRAETGRAGGSKTKAKAKQNESEKEIEYELEKEYELELEYETDTEIETEIETEEEDICFSQ